MRLIGIAFIAGSLATLIRMRVGRVIVGAPAVRGFAMAIVACGRLMVAERHALAGGHDRHALERHDERNDDGEHANEPQAHERIVLLA